MLITISCPEALKEASIPNKKICISFNQKPELIVTIKSKINEKKLFLAT